MVLLFSMSATVSSAPINRIRRLSVAKSLSKRRWCEVICPFLVLDAPSALLVNTMRKLQPCDSVNCLHSVVSRAYVGGDHKNSPEADNYGGEDIEQETRDISLDESQADNIEIKIEKTGKNSRRVTSKVAVKANLQTLWEILTNYERLADIIPGLAVSELLEKRDNFARLFQIGQQSLVFGLKFNAKGTIDCFEKDLMILPFGQKRDIEFKMVDGDFQIFEGKWSIEQGVKCDSEDIKSDYAVGQDFQTTLTYVVDVKPKLWLPVRLVEGRLCREIRANLSCIRQEAENSFQNANSAS